MGVLHQASLDQATLDQYLQSLLTPERFKDYCPNGLQVQGKASIQRLITGVTASLDFIEAAIAAKADAVLVHHGFFWRGESQCITGIKYGRIKALMDASISLFAYHLPLDSHPIYGNNTQLAMRLGITPESLLTPDAPLNPGNIGRFDQSLTLEALKDRLIKALGQTPKIIPGARVGKEATQTQEVQTVAWCTGGAQSYFETAIARGVDVFITGEISEPMVHLARESGVTYVAAGHHATERYGALALGQHIGEHFGIEVDFIDIDSPV